MQHSVYWIHHPDHTDMFTQGYIGVSKFVEKRWKQHCKRTQNRHLKFAIDKYGWDNLIKEVVLVSSKAYCLMIELKLRAKDAVGWNIVKGGGMPPDVTGNTFAKGRPSWNKGLTHSEEARKKISDSVKLQMQNPARKEINRQLLLGKPSLMLGRTHTQETIAKMSAIKLGKLSKKKGIKLSDEQIQKMKQVAINESWVCPHCNTQGKSKGAGNRWHFDNCKQKDKI